MALAEAQRSKIVVPSESAEHTTKNANGNDRPRLSRLSQLGATTTARGSPKLSSARVARVEPLGPRVGERTHAKRPSSSQRENTVGVPGASSRRRYSA